MNVLVRVSGTCRPITFILPPLMWIKSGRAAGGAEVALNWLIAGACTIIALLSLIGSARNIAVLASQFSLFS
jgi:di/tricarboxylate transporter